MGYEYYESDEFNEILHEYEEAIANDNMVFLDADELTDIMEYYKMHEQDDKALDAYRLAVELYPGESAPMIFRARYALAVERDRELSKRIMAQVNDTTNLEYIYLQAEIMFDEQKPQEAEAHLRQHLQNVDEEERDNYILDVLDILIDYSQFELAKNWLPLVQNKQSVEYCEFEGDIANGLGNYTQSIKIFNKLLDQDPYNSAYWNMLSYAQFNTEKMEDSLQSSSFALAINPDDPDALLNAGAACCNMGLFHEAAEHYENYTKLYPENEMGYLYWGIALLDMGYDPEQILEKMNKAYELAKEGTPHHAEICRQLAFVYSQYGNLEKAMQLLDKALSEEGVTKEEYDVVKGHFYLENKQFMQAMLCFRDILANYGPKHDLFYKIGISFYDCGYIKTALEIFENVEKNNAELCKNAYAYMAYCCRETGKEQKYLSYLQKAVAANPFQARYVLGRYYPKDMNPSDYYQHEINKNT